MTKHSRPLEGDDGSMPNRSVAIRVLASRIAAIRRPHPIRVAIDGIDAAGKTMLADELAPEVERLGRPVIRSSVDGFHNPAAVRRRRGPLSPEGYYRDSFDHEGLLQNLLRSLGPGGSLEFRREIFDFRSDQPIDAPPETANPDAVLLFDGVFLLRPELRGEWDFAIFLRVGFPIAVARAEARDLHLFGSVEEVARRYRERYVPGQRLYLKEAKPERWATVIVDNDDPLHPVVLNRAP